MIKDNQTSLNRFHVVLDAIVTALSYLAAWYIVIGRGAGSGRGTLPPEFYFRALIIIVPVYLVLYSFFNLYTPKRILGRSDFRLYALSGKQEPVSARVLPRRSRILLHY